MIVRLDEIKEGGIDRSYSVAATHYPELTALQTAGEAQFTETLQLAFHLERVGSMIEVSGCVRTEIGMQCGRCLKEFRAPLAASFELTFTRESTQRTTPTDDEGIELTAEDLGLVTFHGEEINLDTIVEEQILLAMPVRPLCNETCQGLCPRCGNDLNHQRCECTTEEFHEGKFAALRNLKIST